jgi:hypothetical protein
VPVGFGSPLQTPDEHVGAIWQAIVDWQVVPSGFGVHALVQQPLVKRPSSHASPASRLPLPHSFATNVPPRPFTVAVPPSWRPSSNGAPWNETGTNWTSPKLTIAISPERLNAPVCGSTGPEK